jgi:hypothetical protein
MARTVGSQVPHADHAEASHCGSARGRRRSGGSHVQGSGGVAYRSGGGRKHFSIHRGGQKHTTGWRDTCLTLASMLLRRICGGGTRTAAAVRGAQPQAPLESASPQNRVLEVRS